MITKQVKAILFLLFFYAGSAFGQSAEVLNFVKQGVELHDNGNFTAALEQYEKALALDKKSALVNYEMGSTYFALKNYDKAIEHSNAALSSKEKVAAQAYILKGTAQDLQGKPNDAIKTYKTGIKKSPRIICCITTLHSHISIRSRTKKRCR